MKNTTANNNDNSGTDRDVTSTESDTIRMGVTLEAYKLRYAITPPRTTHDVVVDGASRISGTKIAAETVLHKTKGKNRDGNSIRIQNASSLTTMKFAAVSSSYYPGELSDSASVVSDVSRSQLPGAERVGGRGINNDSFDNLFDTSVDDDSSHERIVDGSKIPDNCNNAENDADDNVMLDGHAISVDVSSISTPVSARLVTEGDSASWEDVQRRLESQEHEIRNLQQHQAAAAAAASVVVVAEVMPPIHEGAGEQDQAVGSSPRPAGPSKRQNKEEVEGRGFLHRICCGRPRSPRVIVVCCVVVSMIIGIAMALVSGGTIENTMVLPTPTPTPTSTATTLPPIPSPIAVVTSSTTTSTPTLLRGSAPIAAATPEAPTSFPTDTPTSPSFVCFTATPELKGAVRSYMNNRDPNSYVSRLYGFPIGSWCVSAIEDFSYLFENSFFNEDIGSWDTSSATTMRGMFRNTPGFNQDLSRWNVSNVMDVSEMFSGAESFNSDVSTWDVSQVSNMNAMFQRAKSFNDHHDLTTWDVSKVTTMAFMFHEATKFNGNVSTWDVSKVNTMTSMFDTAESFYGDLAMWNVSNVIDMGNMFFSAAAFNGDISDWDIRHVTTVEYMFCLATSFNQNLESWNVANVRTFEGQFSAASSFQQNLCKWGDIAQRDAIYTNAFSNSACESQNEPNYAWGEPDSFCGWCFRAEPIMFQPPLYPGETSSPTMSPTRNPCFSSTADLKAAVDSYLAGDDMEMWNLYGDTIETWCVADVHDFSNLFDAERNPLCASFNADISSWDTESATNMQYMFRNAAAFNRSLSSWDLSQVTNIAGMFEGAESFDQDISSWDVSSVIRMDSLFSGATSFNHDLGSWKVTNLASVNNMFDGATSFGKDRADDLSRWDVSRVVSLRSIFANAISFNGNISLWDVTSVEDMSGAFQGATSFDQNLKNWNVGKVTDMSLMFQDAWSFRGQGGMDVWNVSNVRDMRSMFQGASNFNEGNISGWDVSSVTNMNGMFRGAALFYDDISSWDVSVVVDMSNMMMDAVMFDQDLSLWNVSNVYAFQNQFSGASSFRRNLCKWGERIHYTFYIVDEMFANTDCSITQDPDLAASPVAGPFCFECSSAS